MQFSSRGISLRQVVEDDLPFLFRLFCDPAAATSGCSPSEGQSCVKVFCRLGDYPADLRPEMTGHARIYTGRRPIGAIVVDRALRWLRTEFWW